MDKTLRLTLNIPGNDRHLDIGVILADIARKLRDVESLKSGQHEVIVFGDGSVSLDLAMVWEPKVSTVAVPQKKGRAAA